MTTPNDAFLVWYCMCTACLTTDGLDDAIVTVGSGFDWHRFWVMGSSPHEAVHAFRQYTPVVWLLRQRRAYALARQLGVLHD